MLVTTQVVATMCNVLTIGLFLLIAAWTTTSAVHNEKAVLRGISEKIPNRDGKLLPYGLPECSTQQVCNAMYIRLNRIQSLCYCPKTYSLSCSNRMDSADEHTINLIADEAGVPLTLVKICEPIHTVRPCKNPKDWMLLALQSRRTGKSHYLVICHCPSYAYLQGPIKHSIPTYAHIPGINVYGMLCNQGHRKERQWPRDFPAFPWDQVLRFSNSTVWL
ncbi:uncharacterized protein LOC111616052 isoform X1 [Centruroides sculpturatus]|uniref:uncharacterized protein LOC111616052 isoform X1 n=2 Tax=Centruroides sculpturatus TaxID=218467 RepID=UPI000C6E8600|nr:uncharacterized protein LOC111616052 isoform X1 [Centruroides sculpturatus]